MKTLFAIGVVLLRVIAVACVVVGVGVLILFAAVFTAMARSSTS